MLKNLILTIILIASSYYFFTREDVSSKNESTLNQETTLPKNESNTLGLPPGMKHRENPVESTLPNDFEDQAKIMESTSTADLPEDLKTQLDAAPPELPVE